MSHKAASSTVIAVGYGLLPENTGAAKVYQTVTIAAEVDTATHKIVDVSITILTDVSRRWMSQQMFGMNLTDESDTDRFAAVVESGFLGNSHRAIEHAYRDMAQRYIEHFGLTRIRPVCPTGTESELTRPEKAV